jgi:hypothetical protein
LQGFATGSVVDMFGALPSLAPASGYSLNTGLFTTTPRH